MPLIETKGAASAQGFGEFAKSAAVNYIEDVFSTYLYTGNGSTQTITNGIDLSGKGGMVWAKARSAAQNNVVYDTSRGPGTSTTAANQLRTDSTSGVINTQTLGLDYLSAFNSNGFSVVSGGGNIKPLNENTTTYASWTFRKQAKFFDVVTYTGNGSNRTISHTLGSVPGCIIVKRTDTTADWQVYHRSIANTEYLVLNSTAAKATGTTRWNSTTPTSTEFSLGTDTTVNANGGTYVAYIFAHDAGGFGLSGSDNVISCGSYTTSATSDSPIISLGYEPQLVLVKLANTAGDWRLFDNMRGVATGGVDALLRPNLSNAELSVSDYITFNSTGFQQSPNIDTGANTYIYIAIRRGPMKVPTSGTSVFSPIAYTGNGTSNQLVGSITVDASFSASRNRTNPYNSVFSRLMGNKELATSGTTPEYTSEVDFSQQIGLRFTGLTYTATNNNAIQWQFRRAPGFFDVVCYTGNGSGTNTVNHNLQAAPELTIVKSRSTSGAGYGWGVRYLSSTITVFNGWTAGLNLTAQATATGVSNNESLAINSSSFNAYGGGYGYPNDSSTTYIAYLFATCLGVSKVGSYTGSGTTNQIDCGFTGGARFVLIKRTDSTGDWYVYDSARGIVAGDDPYLFLNSTAAEVTSTDYVDTYSAGFELSSTAPAGLNANGGTYIFLAIA